MVNVITAVITVAREFGLSVDAAVPLRSTNNVVVWLRPSDVITKVAPDADRRLADELTWAMRLTALDAPIMPPANGLGASVHRIGDRDVTFWRYAPQDDEPSPSSDSIAVALLELHRALQQCEPPRRAVSDALQLTSESLNDNAFAVGMASDDRLLLLSALRSLAPLVESSRSVVHGSPHRFNMVSVPATSASSTSRPLSVDPSSGTSRISSPQWPPPTRAPSTTSCSLAAG